MTDQQILEPRLILEKAIQKAIDGGWGVNPRDVRVNPDMNKCIDWKIAGDSWITFGYEQVVYGHPFAKALWGELTNDFVTREDGTLMPVYEHHLQQMVIADDPIKYLGEHLNA